MKNNEEGRVHHLDDARCAPLKMAVLMSAGSPFAISNVGDLLGETTLRMSREKRCTLTWAFVDQTGVEPATSPVRAVQR